MCLACKHSEWVWPVEPPRVMPILPEIGPLTRLQQVIFSPPQRMLLGDPRWMSYTFSSVDCAVDRAEMPVFTLIATPSLEGKRRSVHPF